MRFNEPEVGGELPATEIRLLEALPPRGPLTELLLVLYRRRAVGAADVEVFGDSGFLASWLDVSPFG